MNDIFMKKSQNLRRLCLIALVCATGSVSAQNDGFDCDYLLGNWTGHYTYPWGESYSWRAELDESGQWRVHFYNVEGEQYDYQEGFWECDGTYLNTWIEEGIGDPFVHEYRILELDRAHHVYEYISGGEPGPIYRAVRDRPMLRTFD